MHRPMLRALKHAVLKLHRLGIESDASPDVEGIETKPDVTHCIHCVSQMHRPMLRALKPHGGRQVDDVETSDASPDVEGIETPPMESRFRPITVRCIARC